MTHMTWRDLFSLRCLIEQFTASFNSFQTAPVAHFNSESSSDFSNYFKFVQIFSRNILENVLLFRVGIILFANYIHMFSILISLSMKRIVSSEIFEIRK